jgi:hypothetical protein
VARKAREKVVLALGVAAVATIVAAFAIVVVPALRFRWRLRGLADASPVVELAALEWLRKEDPQTLRAHAGALVPALERWLAKHAREEGEAFDEVYIVARRLGNGDPAFLLRLRQSPALWPAAYRAILGLQEPRLLPKDACEATLDRSEERGGVNLLWGTQDRRHRGWTLQFREEKNDFLLPLGTLEIADLGERPLEGVDAIAEDDPRLQPIAPCRRGHVYVISRAPENVAVQFAVAVREHVPHESVRIAWRVLRVEKR